MFVGGATVSGLIVGVDYICGGLIVFVGVTSACGWANSVVGVATVSGLIVGVAYICGGLIVFVGVTSVCGRVNSGCGCDFCLLRKRVIVSKSFPAFSQC